MTTNIEEQDESQYRVHSKVEIVALLKRMQDKNQQLTLKSDSGIDSILTVILDVDEDNNCIIIDAAKSESVNERIIQSPRLFIETLFNNIRITFDVSRAKKATAYEQAALVIPIPSSLVRLQRRDSFRVNTPLLKPLRCTITTETPEGEVQKIATVLKNISLGGIGIVDENCILNCSTGQIFKRCSLQLSESQEIEVDLEIRDCKDVKLTNGKTIRQCGCAFVNLTNRTEGIIQRIITQLERDQNAKKSGLL